LTHGQHMALGHVRLKTVAAAVIRLVIADDQVLTRRAIATLLGLEADLQVVAEVGRVDQLLTVVSEYNPDVVLMDAEMEAGGAIEETSLMLLEDSRVRVLFLTNCDRPGLVSAVLTAGATGILFKETPAPQLAEAVRRVHANQVVVDYDLSKEEPAPAPHTRLASSSPTIGSTTSNAFHESHPFRTTTATGSCLSTPAREPPLPDDDGDRFLPQDVLSCRSPCGYVRPSQPHGGRSPAFRAATLARHLPRDARSC